MNWKRKKTGRKQGAQTGHKGHGRKKQTPTETVILPAPQEALDNPDFKKTGKTIVKQLVGIHMVLDVTEYRADVYYNSKTGERVHAPFPAGVVNDVNYDGSIKAFLFLLNNECCVSIDKSRKFLSDLTNGKNAYVFVTATPDGEAMYFARAKKGHEGVRGTPAEDYNGIIVQDHEKAFYKYCFEDQGWLAHVYRYVDGS